MIRRRCREQRRRWGAPEAPAPRLGGGRHPPMNQDTGQRWQVWEKHDVFIHFSTYFTAMRLRENCRNSTKNSQKPFTWLPLKVYNCTIIKTTK